MKVIYRAKDGTEFDTRESCIRYEEGNLYGENSFIALNKNLEPIKDEEDWINNCAYMFVLNRHNISKHLSPRISAIEKQGLTEDYKWYEWDEKTSKWQDMKLNMDYVYEVYKTYKYVMDQLNCISLRTIGDDY